MTLNYAIKLKRGLLLGTLFLAFFPSQAQVANLWDTLPVPNANCTYNDFYFGVGNCEPMPIESDLRRKYVGKWVYKSIHDSLDRVSIIKYYSLSGADSISLLYYYPDSSIYLTVYNQDSIPISRENRRRIFLYQMNGTLICFTEFISDSICTRTFYRDGIVSEIQLCKTVLDRVNYVVLYSYALIKEEEH